MVANDHDDANPTATPTVPTAGVLAATIPTVDCDSPPISVRERVAAIEANLAAAAHRATTGATANDATTALRLPADPVVASMVVDAGDRPPHGA
jgi:hypothetical protein